MKKEDIEVLMYLTPTQLIVVLMLNFCFLLPCCVGVAISCGYSCGKFLVPITERVDQLGGSAPVTLHDFY